MTICTQLKYRAAQAQRQGGVRGIAGAVVVPLRTAVSRNLTDGGAIGVY